jgi:hypothetical protein
MAQKFYCTIGNKCVQQVTDNNKKFSLHVYYITENQDNEEEELDPEETDILLNLIEDKARQILSDVTNTFPNITGLDIAIETYEE